MFRRLSVASVALSVALVGGCTFTAEIANLEPYDPSDGVGLTLEGVAVRNALLVTADGDEANLVMTIVNTTGDDVALRLQYGAPDARVTEEVLLPAQPELSQVGSDPANQLIFTDDAIEAGTLFPVYFQYGSVQGEIIEVPVLDGTLPEYELLVP
ncbi:MAG: Uncharacterised protein [Cellulomonadaceae bacterium TMED98]|nr:MAG: Uncharacterised protein [Cellulomonadaceae bacterium TMED98]